MFSVSFLARKKNSKSLLQELPEKSLYSIFWDMNVVFNPLSPNSNQNQFSPHHICAL